MARDVEMNGICPNIKISVIRINAEQFHQLQDIIQHFSCFQHFSYLSHIYYRVTGYRC